MVSTQSRSGRLVSPEGRSFRLSITDPVPSCGDLVHITGDALTCIAYVEEVGEPDLEGMRDVAGRLVDPASTHVRTADGLTARPVDATEAADILGGTDPRLHMGRAVGIGDASVGLIAPRLNRHTFWCGQSGSGKTYALGVFLERVLSATRLPIVVLDPNSDYVGLGLTRPDAPADEVAIHASRDVVVLRPDDAASPLRVRFTRSHAAREGRRFAPRPHRRPGASTTPSSGSHRRSPGTGRTRSSRTCASSMTPTPRSSPSGSRTSASSNGPARGRPGR